MTQEQTPHDLDYKVFATLKKNGLLEDYDKSAYVVIQNGEFLGVIASLDSLSKLTLRDDVDVLVQQIENNPIEVLSPLE
jgi:hypothetical protein